MLYIVAEIGDDGSKRVLIRRTPEINGSTEEMGGRVSKVKLVGRSGVAPKLIENSKDALLGIVPFLLRDSRGLGGMLEDKVLRVGR